MKRIQLSNWIMDIDTEKTKEYYDSITVEEGCDCVYCRNYIKGCETFLEQVLDLYPMSTAANTPEYSLKVVFFIGGELSGATTLDKGF